MQSSRTGAGIRDAEGTEGWVYHSMLSGQRTAVAAPWMREKGDNIYVNLRRSALKDANVVAKLQPGVLVKLKECTADWCEAEVDGTEGWLHQGEVWGAYPGEAFKKDRSSSLRPSARCAGAARSAE